MQILHGTQKTVRHIGVKFLMVNISIPVVTDFKDSVPGHVAHHGICDTRHHKSDQLQYPFTLLSTLGF